MASKAELRLDDPEGIAVFRELLADAGYTDAQIHARLGVDSFSARVPARRVLALRKLGGDRLSTLIRLFVLGDSVPSTEAAAALAPLSVERAGEIGLARSSGDAVEPAVGVDPIGPWLVVSDRREQLDLAYDYVYSVAGHSRALASLTISRPAARALDLGTGSGFQAMLATTYAKHVVATDINPRALRFAAFNAALNGVSLDLREGSLFEPVEGDVFDVIVSNPPFVISPDTAFAFRDSGLPGDSFCEALVRAMPRYLAEGGFGHVLVSWGYRRDEAWTAPLARWLNGSGCDAIVIRYSETDALDHAAGGNRPLAGDRAAYGAAIDRWTDYLLGLGIERIGWGGLVLRRRSGGGNWLAAHSPTPAGRFDAAGAQLLRQFAAQDYLRGRSTVDELLAERLRPAPELRVVQRVRLAGEGERLEAIAFRLLGGMHLQIGTDVVTARLLSLLDGRRTLEEAVAESGAGLDAEGSKLQLLRGVEKLLELGFLERVDGAGT